MGCYGPIQEHLQVGASTGFLSKLFDYDLYREVKVFFGTPRVERWYCPAQPVSPAGRSFLKVAFLGEGVDQMVASRETDIQLPRQQLRRQAFPAAHQI